MSSSSTHSKGKGVERGTPEPGQTSRRCDAVDWDDASSSATTYFEVPSNHFLARSGGLPSSSSLQAFLPGGQSCGGANQLGSRSSSSNKGSRRGPSYPPLPTTDEARSTGSLTSDDRDPLSHIPSHISQSFSHGHPSQLSGGQLPRPFMPDTSTLAAADFDIDVRSGFLPPQAPVSRLEGIEEELWECALDRARTLPLRIGGGGRQVCEAERREAFRWRKGLREMLILHPSPQLTSDIRFARRAHLVLSWLAHFYIHSQPSLPLPSKQSVPWRSLLSSRSQEEKERMDEDAGKYAGIVPAAIAVPWVALSRQLDLPPILTYATTVLWNWSLCDPTLGVTKDNVRMTTTFSGTPSEEHFYKTSLLIEKRGVDALTLMRRSLDEAFVGDTLARRRISIYLGRLSTVIQDLTKLLHDVRLGCDPSTFYWGIRPWFNGGDSIVDPKTGEKGWIYEGVEEYEGKRMLFMGPSAGQSSLIHSLDVFLGVDHSQKKPEERSEHGRENATFMEKMQFYMPGHHRNFLNHLKGISFTAEAEEQSEGEEGEKVEVERHPLRALMTNTKDGDSGGKVSTAVEMLRLSFNEVLTSLKHLRDEHMRIATVYIVSQMRTAPPMEYSKLSENLVSRANDGSGATERGAKGTGGTDLVSFLKDCRANTIAALHR